MNGRAAAVRLPAMSAHRLMWLAGLLIGVVGLMMLYAPDPVHSRLCAPCPFHLLTGLYCPGCGTTRALHQLLHGHIRAALGLNPLMVALLPWVVYAGISQAAGRELPGTRLSPRWIWGLLAVVIAYWILRNIPTYPFCLLAP